jgi:hypothetical protein
LQCREDLIEFFSTHSRPIHISKKILCVLKNPSQYKKIILKKDQLHNLILAHTLNWPVEYYQKNIVDKILSVDLIGAAQQYLLDQEKSQELYTVIGDQWLIRTQSNDKGLGYFFDYQGLRFVCHTKENLSFAEHNASFLSWAHKLGVMDKEHICGKNVWKNHTEQKIRGLYAKMENQAISFFISILNDNSLNILNKKEFLFKNIRKWQHLFRKSLLLTLKKKANMTTCKATATKDVVAGERIALKEARYVRGKE